MLGVMAKAGMRPRNEADETFSIQTQRASLTMPHQLITTQATHQF
jgi:hypothetical protein